MARKSTVDTTLDPVIQRMLSNYELSADAFSDDRRRALAALRFRQGGDDQWDSKMLSLRREGNRPSEVYNQIPRFIHQVTNDQRLNMPQTRFIAGNDGSKEVAEAYEDYCRNVQASSEGEVAYDTACDNQVSCGWGYWRYVTQYESDKSFDQNIAIKWIPNIFTIYDDPTAIEQDFLDRKFLIQVYDIPLKQFNKDYKGGKDDEPYDSVRIQSIGDKQKDWANADMVRIAEYWEVTEEIEKLYRVNGKSTKEKPSGEIAPEDVRDVVVPKVMWYKCTGDEVLERREWPGKYIPYVRISGEMLIIDGKTYYSGLIEGMMSAQRQYNFWANTATEIMSLAPLSPWIADPRSIEGYEQYWDTANVKKYSVLPYNAIVENGVAVPPPQRNSSNSDVSGALALVQQAQQNFYATSGLNPAGLGEVSNEKSGKAIMARQREGDISTYHYADNLARGQRAGGRIFLDLAQKIVDGARIITGTREDGTTREIMINQKFKDPKSGKEKELDLTVGTYDVVVTTGPSFTTKRQESADAMLTLASSTNLMEVAPDEFYKAQDWPGADKIAERYKKLLPPNLTEDDAESPIPPQVKNQMAQMEQVIQQLQAQLQQAAQELQSNQADVQAKQADLQIKFQEMQMKGQSDALKAEYDRAKLDLDSRKLDLEEQKIQLDATKMQLDAYQSQVQASQPQQPVAMEGDMKFSVQTLQQMLEDAQMQEQNAAMEQEQMTAQQMAHQEAMMMKEQEDRARSDALLQGLMGIQTMLSGLTASITAPKVVVRDPVTGMATGVITQDTVGNA